MPGGPFRAYGRLEINSEGAGGGRDNLPVKLWVNPPYDLYIQGDAAFDPKAVIAGCNAREFWLWIKPGSMKGYWWGEWPFWGRAFGLAVNPALVLEAFFPAGTHPDPERSRFYEADGFSVIETAGTDPARRIYLPRCGGPPARVEYLEAGRVMATMELSGYVALSRDFSMPSRIIIKGAPAEGQMELHLRLSRVEPVKLNERQLEALFTRPRARGDAPVYRVTAAGIEEAGAGSGEMEQ
jgi:hypothetical protein